MAPNKTKRAAYLTLAYQGEVCAEDECGQIASGDYGRLVRLAQHLDDLLSRLDKKRKDGRVTARRRQGMRKAANRMRAKFKDLVDELHWKTIRFLVDNFDVILLPTFETSQMVQR